MKNADYLLLAGHLPPASKPELRVVTWNGRRVRTEFICPPIPIRQYDYSAWIDGTEDIGMIQGYGPSREMAIADLIQQLWEGF